MGVMAFLGGRANSGGRPNKKNPNVYTMNARIENAFTLAAAAAAAVNVIVMRFYCANSNWIFCIVMT